MKLCECFTFSPVVWLVKHHNSILLNLWHESFAFHLVHILLFGLEILPDPVLFIGVVIWARPSACILIVEGVFSELSRLLRCSGSVCPVILAR